MRLLKALHENAFTGYLQLISGFLFRFLMGLKERKSDKQGFTLCPACLWYRKGGYGFMTPAHSSIPDSGTNMQSALPEEMVVLHLIATGIVRRATNIERG